MYQRILVPVDGSTTSLKGLDEAIRLARLTGGQLRLLHVVEELVLSTGFEGYAAYSGDLIAALVQGGRQLLQEAKARAGAAGVTADTMMVETVAVRAADIVIEQAQSWGAELIVLGTHGRRGVRRVLLGSDAEQIVRMAPVPVLLVRAAQDGGA
jgi:nucleotide-binding universal stress UspA family protein